LQSHSEWLEKLAPAVPRELTLVHELIELDLARFHRSITS
jgi:hypothetical protein